MEDLGKVREEVSLWGDSWLFKAFSVKSGHLPGYAHLR